jgi:hypothetical protein
VSGAPVARAPVKIARVSSKGTTESVNAVCDRRLAQRRPRLQSSATPASPARTRVTACAQRRRIPAASERLQRGRPRVSPEVRERRPQVVLLHAHGVARDSGELVALVSEGAHSYSVRLELEHAAAGWRVIDVGS